MYHTCAEREKKECVYNSLQIRLREFGSWFHATWLRRLRPSLYVGKGGEARRGEEAAMAISITCVSENNGQIMTVKVVNVSAAAAISLRLASRRAAGWCAVLRIR